MLLMLSIFVFLFSFSLASASAPDPADTVAYYTLDETSGTTASDSTPNGNDGTANNNRVFTSNTGTSGIINSGADLTQDNDWINLGTIDDTTNSFTYSMWVNFASLPNGGCGDIQTFFGHRTGSTTSTYRYMNYHPSSCGQNSFQGFVGNIELDSGIAPSIDTWYHVVLTFDGTTAKLYVDDVETDSGTGAGTLSNNDISIGRREGSNNQYINGKVDEVGIWDRALTSDEVSYLYAEGSPDSIQQYPFSDEPDFIVETTADFNVEEVFTTTSGIRGVGSLNQSQSDARVNYKIIRERSGSNTTLVDSFTTSFTGLNWETSQTVSSANTIQGDKLFVEAQVVNSSNTSQLFSSLVTSDALVVVNRDPLVNDLYFDRGEVAVSAQDIKGFINVNDLDGDDLDVSWELRKGSTTGFGSGTLVSSDDVLNIAKNSNVELFTLSSANTAVGDFFRIDVTVTDDYTGETSTSSQEIEIISSLSDVDRIVFNKDPVYTLDDVIATVVLDQENDGDIEVYYEVRVNAGVVSSGTLTNYYTEAGEYFFELPTISSSVFVQEDVVEVYAEPRNSEGDVIGGNKDNSFTVVNRVPTISSTRFDPTVLVDTLSFRIFTTVNDLDLDSLNISYRVERTRSGDTTEIATGTALNINSPYNEVELAEISSSLINVDDQIRFFVTVTDGYDSSNEVQSDLLTVTEVTDTVITAVDSYSDQAINDFSVNFYDNTNSLVYNFTSENGAIQLEEGVVVDGTYTLEFFNISDRGGYFNKNFSNIEVNYPYINEFSLEQAFASFEAYEIATEEQIVNFTFTIDSVTYNSSQNISLSAGNYTVLFSKAGFANQTISIEVLPKTSNIFTFNDVSDASIELSVQDFINGSSINTFSGIIKTLDDSFSLSFSTTNGVALVPFLQGLDYIITLNPVDDYAINFGMNHTFSGNQTSLNHTFRLYTENSIRFEVYDEATNELITQNVNVLISGDPYEESFNFSGGEHFKDKIIDGVYNIKISSEGYDERNYLVSVAHRSTQLLKAYLASNTTQVTFTTLDLDSNNIISDASITMFRSVNNTWQTVESRSTDITGRAVFNYVPGSSYRFVANSDGYLEKSFVLNPIIFEFYNVRLSRTASIETDAPFSNVLVSYEPKKFLNNNQNNFTWQIQSTQGVLTNYTLNVTYPGGNYFISGSNSIGELIYHEFNLSNVNYNDQVIITYTYTTVFGIERTFTSSYSIGDAPTERSWSQSGEAYGLGVFETSLVTVGLTIFVAGIATFVGGMLAGGVLGMFMLGFFASIGFIPLWAALISLFMGFMLLVGRSK